MSADGANVIPVRLSSLLLALCASLCVTLGACSVFGSGTDTDRQKSSGKGRDGAVDAGKADSAGKADDAIEDPKRRKDPNYALDVNAPKEVQDLVRDNTLFGKWQYRSDFDPAQLELFRYRFDEEVRQAMYAEGWFDPDIELGSVSADKVVINVKEGPRVTVRSVDLEFQGEITQPGFDQRRAALRRNWGLKDGEPFTQSKWGGAKSAVLDNLKREGFPRAEIVDSRAEIRPEDRSAKLSVKVDSGPRMGFGNVRFHGLERYEEKIPAALAPFNEGDPYSLRKLVDYQTALQQTGYFRSVTVLPDLAPLESDEARRSIDVDVQVIEAQSQRLTTGFGITTDRGLRGQIGWTDRNLFDRGWVFDSRLLVDQKSMLANVGLRTPVDSQGGYWGTGARLSRESIESIRNEVATAHLGYGRVRDNTEWFASLAWQYDHQTIFDGINPVATTNARAWMPGITWTMHRFDDRLFPTRGHSLRLELGAASRNLWSTQSFVRSYAKGVKFLPVPSFWPQSLRRDRLMVTLEGGAVLADSREGIPSIDLFRTGGSQTVRGYRFLSLGLKRGDATLGTRYLLAGSLEYQHPVTDIVTVAVFHDRGNAFDSWGDRQLVSGYGAGVRLRTPVGPINLDLAYGQAERRFRVHFSIGYSF